MKQALVLAGLVMTVCLPSQESVRIGEPFSLKIDALASLDEVELSLTFSDVTHDSRCPKDVNCVVAGKAVIIFEASTVTETTELTFEIPPGGNDEQTLGDLAIQIVELGPEPEGGKRMERSSYVATVLVSLSAP